ncbi:MAG UNVERIFIED_CONTAM: hypothetical protein LVR18_52330 [Planctomycetaceae bacterium]
MNQPKFSGHVDTRQVVTASGALPGTLTLGYAATTHKMQGNTVSNSFLLLGGTMTSRELAYVQATSSPR